jgi:hypothetical protein
MLLRLSVIVALACLFACSVPEDVATTRRADTTDTPGPDAGPDTAPEPQTQAVCCTNADGRILIRSKGQCPDGYTERTINGPGCNMGSSDPPYRVCCDMGGSTGVVVYLTSKQCLDGGGQILDPSTQACKDGDSANTYGCCILSDGTYKWTTYRYCAVLGGEKSTKEQKDCVTPADTP